MHAASSRPAADWDYRARSDTPDHRRRETAKARIEGLTWLMDRAVRIPGTRYRVGLDGIIGLVPGVGDAATTALALWFVYEAHKLGAPSHVIGRMLANVAVDTAVGSIPIVGDLFDFAFKANVRNREVLRRHMGI